MFKNNLKFTIGVMLLGFCASTSSSLAHNPGKIHVVHYGHKHVVTVVKKPVVPVVTKTVVVAQPVVVVKRPVVSPIRRAIRITRRY